MQRQRAAISKTYDGSYQEKPWNSEAEDGTV